MTTFIIMIHDYRDRAYYHDLERWCAHVLKVLIEPIAINYFIRTYCNLQQKRVHCK
jgi:hypothetical protein